MKPENSGDIRRNAGIILNKNLNKKSPDGKIHALMESVKGPCSEQIICPLYGGQQEGSPSRNENSSGCQRSCIGPEAKMGSGAHDERREQWAWQHVLCKFCLRKIFTPCPNPKNRIIPFILNRKIQLVFKHLIQSILTFPSVLEYDRNDTKSIYSLKI